MSDEEAIGYADAMQELEAILDELEGDELDVDVLAERVRRASELIKICRSRITRAQDDVARIVADLEDFAPEEAPTNSAPCRLGSGGGGVEVVDGLGEPVFPGPVLVVVAVAVALSVHQPPDRAVDAAGHDGERDTPAVVVGPLHSARVGSGDRLAQPGVDRGQLTPPKR